MKIHIIKFSLLIAVILLSSCEAEKSNLALLSSQIPTDTPLVFSPNVLTTSEYTPSSITFNPDMTELVFNYRKQGDLPNIYTIKLKDGKWSKPEQVPFSSDEYLDFHARFTSDGNRLYYRSTRPIPDTVKTSNPRRRLHQWYVEKNEHGDWGEPVLMGATVCR